ncbi:MAG: lysylphosphatidylglycerol synthase domain-containing protein [Kofleriaceae bacterium]
MSERRAPPEADGERPRWLRWLTRIALAAGAVGLGVTIYLVGPSEIVAHLRAIGAWFVVLVAIDLSMSACDTAAVHALTRGPGGPTLGPLLVSQLAGRAVNAVTPGGTIGDVLKASILSEAARGPAMVAAVLRLNLTSLCISLAVIAVGAPISAALLDVPGGVRLGLGVAAVLAAATVAVIVALVHRGMLASLVRVARALHLVGGARAERWHARLAEIDDALRGDRARAGRGASVAWVAASKGLGYVAIWLIVFSAGYTLGLGELAALLSAGVVLGWLSLLVPMGLGVAEGGNYGLFALIGAPAPLGVSLALAHRLRQIVVAAIGFSALGIFRLRQRSRRRTPERPAPAPSSTGL